MEEGDFTIFDMSSCKNDKSKKPLTIIDQYMISKTSKFLTSVDSLLT